LLVEHIVEEQAWADELKRLLKPFDPFWVGVHASMSDLERRELSRGNRTLGEAVFHLKTHQYCAYDVEVDTSQPVALAVDKVMQAWSKRSTR